MNRVIVDYEKIKEEVLALLVEKFPYGYAASDIIAFRNAKNEEVKCVEVKTEEVIYLVKISRQLVNAMEDFESEDDNIEDDEFVESPEEVEDF